MPKVTRKFKIKNRLGMHARSAATFVHLANRFQASIAVSKGKIRANGKSIMAVLQLGAVQGEIIQITANGKDSRDALETLGELIESRFGEEE